MNFEQVRALASSLPEVVESPHFNYASFRVRGKIFMTVPPEETHVHLFVGEEDRERVLALHPEFAEKLMWGAKAAGVRIALAKARPDIVLPLVQKAWANKAPKPLVSATASRPARDP